MHRRRGRNGGGSGIDGANTGGVHWEVQEIFQGEWFRSVSKNKGEIQMATSKERDVEHRKGHLAMNTQPIVSTKEWEAAREQLLVKEKDLTRARDALAAERRRMPW